MNIEKSLIEGELTLSISGRLDTITHAEFETEAEEILSDRDRSTVSCVILDFSNLDYISSAGLRSILKLQKDLTAKNIALSITNPNELVSEVLSITGFNQILKVD